MIRYLLLSLLKLQIINIAYNALIIDSCVCVCVYIYIIMYKHQLSNIYCLVDNNFIAETHKN